MLDFFNSPEAQEQFSLFLEFKNHKEHMPAFMGYDLECWCSL